MRLNRGESRCQVLSVMLLAVVFQFAAYQSHAAKGGDSSGGGNVVHRGQSDSWVLLDYYAFNPALQIESAAGSNLIIERAHGQQKSVPKVLARKQPAAELLQTRLERWRPHATGTVVAVEKALSTMHFYAVANIDQHNRYYLPQHMNSSSLQIRTAVGYSRSYGGALISAEVWNRLNLMSQAGLLLHEAFRHIQFYDEFIQKDSDAVDSLQDISLQALAALIMLTEPIIENTQAILAYSSQSRFIRAHLYASDTSAQAARSQQICDWLKEYLRHGKKALNVQQSSLCLTSDHKSFFDLSYAIWASARDNFQDVYASTQRKNQNRVIHLHKAMRDQYHESLIIFLGANDLDIDRLLSDLR